MLNLEYRTPKFTSLFKIQDSAPDIDCLDKRY